MGTSIKILICSHKEVELPLHKFFFPVQAGAGIAERLLPYEHDNSGDNISSKNRNYCELTAHYWAWKNLKGTDIIGLNHYRRYFDFGRCWKRFSPDRGFINTTDFLSRSYQFPDMEKILKEYDIILPNTRNYPYNITTQYSVYHIVDDWNIVREVIRELYPEYMEAFTKTMDGSNTLSHYNMFITSWKNFEGYSEWLFRILFEVEKRIKISAYPVQARVFGYISERLINVYCAHHRFKIAHYPVIMPLDDYQGQADLGNLHYLFRRVKNNLSYWLGK